MVAVAFTGYGKAKYQERRVGYRVQMLSLLLYIPPPPQNNKKKSRLVSSKYRWCVCLEMTWPKLQMRGFLPTPFPMLVESKKDYLWGRLVRYKCAWVLYSVEDHQLPNPLCANDQNMPQRAARNGIHSVYFELIVVIWILFSNYNKNSSSICLYWVYF